MSEKSEVRPVDEAAALFMEGYACSQAILLAYAPGLGLNKPEATRLGAGFAAGMHLGGMCGAVSAAIMVLGLALGGDDCASREGRARLAGSVCEFADRFMERVGALNCPEIIGCDLRTPEGMAMAHERHLFETTCLGVVRDAALILDEVLAEADRPAA